MSQKIEEPVQCPFDVYIDTAEQSPFLFQDIYADANEKCRLMSINRRFLNLGRHPNSLGDYSGSEMLGKCHVERKSVSDIQGTILGWPTEHEKDCDLPMRRERFEQELDNLSKIDAAMVVIEGTLQDCLGTMPEYGVKSAEVNQKIFFRSWISYSQRFSRVQWAWADNRRLAEVIVFRFLHRYYRKMKLRERILRRTKL